MDIIIFGTSKVAQVVYSYIKDDNSYNIVAFCVDKEYQNKHEIFDIPVVSFEEIEQKFPPSKIKMLIAIGYHQMNKIREQKCQEAIEKGYELVSYINKKADVSSTATIGKNCIILDNVSVEPFAQIGDNTCLYCNSTIAHHSKVGNNCWVTSGTVIGGNSTVGDNCFLGINSTIGHNIEIGSENFIGAGALVTKNSKNKAVFVVPDTPKYRLNVDQFMKLFKFD